MIAGARQACFPLFHVKTFLDRVSPRYRSQLAFPFSPQNLPGTRSAPISQPACFPLFMSKPSGHCMIQNRVCRKNPSRIFACRPGLYFTDQVYSPSSCRAFPPRIADFSSAVRGRPRKASMDSFCPDQGQSVPKRTFSAPTARTRDMNSSGVMS